jgi:hypothetical protein
MVTRSSTGSEQQTVRLGQGDLVDTDDGRFRLPVILTNDDGWQTREYLTFDSNEAARLHAQLDRRLNRGWAMTESAKVARQTGETYSVSGSGHLNLEGPENDPA